MFDQINEMKSYLDDLSAYSKKDGSAVAYVNVDYLNSLLTSLELEIADLLDRDTVGKIDAVADKIEKMSSKAFCDASKYAPSCSKSYIEGEACGLHRAALALRNAAYESHEQENGMSEIDILRDIAGRYQLSEGDALRFKSALKAIEDCYVMLPTFDDGSVVQVGDYADGMDGDGQIVRVEVSSNGDWTIYDDISDLYGDADDHPTRLRA